MNRRVCFTVVFLLCVSISTLAQDSLKLRRIPAGAGKLELSWRGSSLLPDGTLRQPYFELDRSADLRQWQPLGERMRARDESDLRLELESNSNTEFYRLRAFEPHLSSLATESAEVFGYGKAFDDELRRVGQISAVEFQQMFAPSNQYLEQITWDPRTAVFWKNFDTNGYHLNAQELDIFRKNGFVVSERLAPQGGLFGTPSDDSFADLFYQLWFKDLPVFITTDAILQAWHRSYDAILEEVEESFLASSLEQMLDAMASRVPELWSETGGGVLKDSILDADFYLTVARSLLGINQVASQLGQDQRVSEALNQVRSLQLVETMLFGECRKVDFSQFQVRGHYTHSARLGRYFQCSMWLGRMDFMVAGGKVARCDGPATPIRPRETGTAIVLWDLLHRSEQFKRWLDVDKVLQSFVGWSDSLGFGHLSGLLAAAGTTSVRDVPDLPALERIQNAVLEGDLGVQNIRSDYYCSPLGEEKAQLPGAFLFLGQRFVPDSWALSQTVFDSIFWVENGATRKIQRRLPSALDVAFSVLGNNQVVPELVARISNTSAPQSALHAVRWRDGLPYQHNLAAVRRVIDSQPAFAWETSIYMGWLAALRELSTPTTAPPFPEAMRTRAWAMKTLNTQLASWTQLRHDNVLYAKQSYTAGLACFYPTGFVEPRTNFWDRLQSTVERAANLIQQLPYTGEITYPQLNVTRTNNFFWTQTWVTNTVPLTAIQSNQVNHLRSFAAVVGKLAEMSRKELAQLPFTSNDDVFIKNLIQAVGTAPFGSGGIRKYDGWYPRLFYRGIQFLAMNGSALFVPEDYFHENFGANSPDRLVVDVHTDVPAPLVQDEGSVLHNAIGSPNLLMIAVDNGSDHMIYAGPVLSHYEFEITGPPFRLTDFYWDLGLTTKSWPLSNENRLEGVVPPAWTKPYLVPKP